MPTPQSLSQYPLNPNKTRGVLQNCSTPFVFTGRIHFLLQEKVYPAQLCTGIITQPKAVYRLGTPFFPVFEFVYTYILILVKAFNIIYTGTLAAYYVKYNLK
jgi:hypothetical protein